MDPWSLLKSMKKVFVLLYHNEGIRAYRERFLRWTGLMAGGFLSLTAFQAEGCGGGFAADLKRGRGWRRRLCRRVASLPLRGRQRLRR